MPQELNLILFIMFINYKYKKINLLILLNKVICS